MLKKKIPLVSFGYNVGNHHGPVSRRWQLSPVHRVHHFVAACSSAPAAPSRWRPPPRAFPASTPFLSAPGPASKTWNGAPGGGSAREQGGGRGSSARAQQRAGRGRPSVVRDSPRRGPVPPPVFAASLGGAVPPPVWGKGEASRGNRSCLGGESQCEGQGGAGRCRSARQQPDCAAPSCSAPGAPAKAALPALPPSTQPSARSCQAGGGGRLFPPSGSDDWLFTFSTLIGHPEKRFHSLAERWTRASRVQSCRDGRGHLGESALGRVQAACGAARRDPGAAGTAGSQRGLPTCGRASAAAGFGVCR